MMADGLPDGFVVDQPGDNAAPAANAPPSGFVVDQPTSTLGALWQGVKSGLTAGWNPEIKGAMAQSGLEAELPYLPDDELKNIEDAGGPQGAYTAVATQERKSRAAAQTQHPAAYGAGNIMGAAAPMIALGPEAAPTLLGRAGQSATMGGIYGAASGAEPGTTLGEKARGALTGAGFGAATGAIAAPIAEGVGHAAGFLTAPIAGAVRGALNPEAEGARRIIMATQRDLAARGPTLSPDELAAAQRAGIPRAIIDAGNETTRALARSAANTSPEARAALSGFINDRFETQAPRAAAFIDQLVGGAGDVGTTREALQTAARQMNGPAYRAAYAAGDRGLWSPELERLSGSPAVIQAMREAVQNGQTRSIADGFGAFNPGVHITDDGRLLFTRPPAPAARNETAAQRLQREMNWEPAPAPASTARGGTGVPTYPNLQFWDYTYRNLRDAGQAAVRSGRNSEGSAINAVAGSLRNELDSLVPEYQTARSGAARWFGAADALEAGQNFATSRMNNADAIRGVQTMNPAERALFMRGYASQLINKIQESGDRRSIANVFGNSPADRQRAVIALGPQRANQLEAYVRAERILDTARGAVTGNSTTARQLAELGLAGGAYGLGTQGDITHPTPSGILAAALAYGAMRGNAAINQRLAQRVGEMLTADDPAVLRQGFQILGRNGGFLNALRAFDTASLTAGGASTAPRLIGPPSVPSPAYGQEQQQQVPGPGNQQHHGGAIRQKPRAAGGKVEAKHRENLEQKATKTQAHYRHGDKAEHCGICSMFRPPAACTAVRGFIAKQAVCKFFEKKKNLDHDGGAKSERTNGHHTAAKINNSYHIRSGADSGDDGTVFVDRRIPKYSPKLKDKNGNPANLWKYLAIHETDEAGAQARGMSYDDAHTDVATPAERAAVEADGVNWKEYTAEIDGYLAKIERQKATRLPPEHLHVDPDAAIGHHKSSNKQRTGDRAAA